MVGPRLPVAPASATLVPDMVCFWEGNGLKVVWRDGIEN